MYRVLLASAALLLPSSLVSQRLAAAGVRSRCISSTVRCRARQQSFDRRSHPPPLFCCMLATMTLSTHFS